jgi:CRP/FNR family transcriptional regulator, cyclic AMP receptor protein
MRTALARGRLSSGEVRLMAATAKLFFDPLSFSLRYGGVTFSRHAENHVIYEQGSSSGAVFYIQSGQVKLTVLSVEGKEGVVAVLEAGDFCGEGCLADQLLSISTAVTMTECVIVRLERATVTRAIQEDLSFSEFFVSYLLARNLRLTEDLIDQLFNSSERRLARVLLLLAHFETDRQEVLLPNINQETLAKMIGTTRSRVNTFMNKFRRLGFIDYNGQIKVHSSLLKVVLHDPS